MACETELWFSGTRQENSRVRACMSVCVCVLMLCVFSSADLRRCVCVCHFSEKRVRGVAGACGWSAVPLSLSCSFLKSFVWHFLALICTVISCCTYSCESSHHALLCAVSESQWHHCPPVAFSFIHRTIRNRFSIHDCIDHTSDKPVCDRWLFFMCGGVCQKPSGGFSCRMETCSAGGRFFCSWALMGSV